MVHNFAWLAQGREPITAADEGELLFVSEKELTIELQKIRRELYFLHAAALSLAGQAFPDRSVLRNRKRTASPAPQSLRNGFHLFTSSLRSLVWPVNW
jgi:hypothetical protein